MKLYAKPVLNSLNVESSDIITVSNIQPNFVKDVASEGTQTKAFDFDELFEQN